MPNRSKTKTNLGLFILIALALSAFLTNVSCRETVDMAVSYYQNLFTPEAEAVPETTARPSPGEMAHNENYFGIGRLETHDYKGAVDKFILATTLDPDNPVYHANLAIAYEKTGQHDSAIDQLTIALKSQPDNPNFLSWLGNAYSSRKQWKDAADAYDRAIRYGTNDHRILFNAAQAYLEIGARIKAIGAIDTAIALKGDDPDYLLVSGMVRYGFKRYEDAIEALKKAKRISPDNPEIDEWIQRAYKGLRDTNLPRTINRTDSQVDENSRGSDNSRQKKIDEIYSSTLATYCGSGCVAYYI